MLLLVFVTTQSTGTIIQWLFSRCSIPFQEATADAAELLKMDRVTRAPIASAQPSKITMPRFLKYWHPQPFKTYVARTCTQVSMTPVTVVALVTGLKLFLMLLLVMCMNPIPHLCWKSPPRSVSFPLFILMIPQAFPMMNLNKLTCSCLCLTMLILLFALLACNF